MTLGAAWARLIFGRGESAAESVYELRREGRVMTAVVDQGTDADRLASQSLPGAMVETFPVGLEDVMTAPQPVLRPGSGRPRRPAGGYPP